MPHEIEVTEAQFQRAVIDLALVCDWKVFHVSDSRRPGPRGTWVGDRLASGFPDLVLVKDRVIYRELKVGLARLRPEQQVWIARLQDAGADAKVWRPVDWVEIERELRGATR
jgi:hypothetical protein